MSSSFFGHCINCKRKQNLLQENIFGKHKQKSYFFSSMRAMYSTTKTTTKTSTPKTMLWENSQAIIPPTTAGRKKCQVIFGDDDFFAMDLVCTNKQQLVNRSY